MSIYYLSPLISRKSKGSQNFLNFFILAKDYPYDFLTYTKPEAAVLKGKRHDAKMAQRMPSVHFHNAYHSNTDTRKDYEADTLLRASPVCMLEIINCVLVIY